VGRLRGGAQCVGCGEPQIVTDPDMMFGQAEFTLHPLGVIA
jgi:hypothetical protein